MWFQKKKLGVAIVLASLVGAWLLVVPGPALDARRAEQLIVEDLVRRGLPAGDVSIERCLLCRDFTYTYQGAGKTLRYAVFEDGFLGTEMYVAEGEQTRR